MRRGNYPIRNQCSEITDYDSYDYNAVSCKNAEFLQPRLLQFKTNYYDIEMAKFQAEILRKTIDYFDKQ